MKKIGLLALMFLMGTTVLFADIGENFEAAGVVIGGDIYLRFEAGHVLGGGNPQLVEISLRPNFGLLISDNLETWLSPRLYYTHYFGWDNEWQAEMWVGLNYYFVTNPRANTGFVPSVGFGLGFSYQSDKDIFFFLAPRLGLFYFVTDRIAPYVMIEATLEFPKWSGYEFYVGDAWLTDHFWVGISFFIPNRDMVL